MEWCSRDVVCVGRLSSLVAHPSIASLLGSFVLMCTLCLSCASASKCVCVCEQAQEGCKAIQQIWRTPDIYIHTTSDECESRPTTPKPPDKHKTRRDKYASQSGSKPCQPIRSNDVARSTARPGITHHQQDTQMHNGAPTWLCKASIQLPHEKARTPEHVTCKRPTTCAGVASAS